MWTFSVCRCGEFYEAVGFDACMLVEYANLNPMAPRSDSVPRAGCPIMNLRQTLDQLTFQGFSVCIVEEVHGPQAKGQLKERFVAGHAHPGSPYVYGLVSADVDLEFPEPIPVMGISRSRRGYCLISVLEMMHSFSVEDGLTEEAVVTKLRSRQCQQLFMHRSLRKDTAGIARWAEGGKNCSHSMLLFCIFQGMCIFFGVTFGIWMQVCCLGSVRRSNRSGMTMIL
jgi:DNA mismatch repair ATPase MutS